MGAGSLGTPSEACGLAKGCHMNYFFQSEKKHLSTLGLGLLGRFQKSLLRAKRVQAPSLCLGQLKVNGPECEWQLASFCECVKECVKQSSERLWECTQAGKGTRVSMSA